MAHALHDPVRHDVWAATRLLEFCRSLDEHTLNATVPGAYGTILAILRQVIYCEIDVLERLLGCEPSDPWRLGDASGLDALREHAARLAADWEVFLASDVDGERPRPPDETEPSPGDGIPAGGVIAVVLHHGSEHRRQVCTIRGALGHELPDLTPCAYAAATRRGTPDSARSAASVPASRGYTRLAARESCALRLLAQSIPAADLAVDLRPGRTTIRIGWGSGAAQPPPRDLLFGGRRLLNSQISHVSRSAQGAIA